MEGVIVEISVSEVRTELAEVINRVRYGRERIVVTRHGTSLVAIIPVDELHFLENAATDEGPLAASRHPQLLDLSSESSRSLSELPAAHLDPRQP